MVNEATLVLIKPEAIQKGLIGIILTRLETLGFEIIGAKAVRVERELAEEHYKHLRTQPFYEGLLNHIQGKIHDTPYVLAFVFYGPNAVSEVRRVAGATHPEKAEPRSIRGSLGRMTAQGCMENVLHASSDSREAKREIKLWFKPEELLR